MKSTDRFKETIKSYLDKLSENDSLFHAAYHKENKNIDGCITYILNTVQKSGCNGFTDDEIYSMAMHYYDEDNIDAGKDINMDVVVNHKIELTEQEKQEAKEKAIRELVDENKKRLQKKPDNKPKIVDTDAKLEEIISGDMSDHKDNTSKTVVDKKGMTIIEQTLF